MFVFCSELFCFSDPFFRLFSLSLVFLPGFLEGVRLEHSIGQAGASVDCFLFVLMLFPVAHAYDCVVFCSVLLFGESFLQVSCIVSGLLEVSRLEHLVGQVRTCIACVLLKICLFCGMLTK